MAGMLDSVRALPGQFEAGFGFVGEVGCALRGIERVVVCGMGGSAFPGDLLNAYVAPLGVDLRVSRDYVVRDPLGPGVLVVASSFSGNTEESLAAMEDALERGAQVVAISAGGALEARAKERSIPYIHIEKPTPTFQPRAAMGYFVSALLGLLENVGLVGDVREGLLAVGRRLSTLDVEGQARALCDALVDRIPVILSTHPFVDTAARVIKIKLNENAKVPAFFYGVPEFNHNEMVGYTRLTGPFTVVVLRDPDVAPRMARRLDVTASTLRENGVPVVEVPLVDGTDVEKLFCVMYLFDFVSCYLAEAAGIDPNPVAMVEDFKAALG